MLTTAFPTHPYKPISVYSHPLLLCSCTVSLRVSLPSLQARRTPLPSRARLISPSPARSATVGLFLALASSSLSPPAGLAEPHPDTIIPLYCGRSSPYPGY
ncbi:unnamed protein product [Victoria cruziana]